jgi:hypothetical protein
METTDTTTTVPDQPAGDDDAKGVTPAQLDDMIAATATLGAEQRLWLKSCRTMIHQRSQETDPSPRVQLALDLVFIAACEAARRILNQVGLRDEAE